jgi:hypothetical protein
MEPLPKIACERLQAGRVVEHPDADLLTAFAEQTLSERERSEVTDHLSRCADCRQVVSLATGLNPSLANAVLTSRPISYPRARLLSWPVLRWGALAACIVVVSAAGLLLTRRSLHKPEKMAGKFERVETSTALNRRSNDQAAATTAQSPVAELKQQVPQPTSKADLVAQSKLSVPAENRKRFLKLPDERMDKKDAGRMAFAPSVAGKVAAEKPPQAPAMIAPTASGSNQASADAASRGRKQVASATPAALPNQNESQPAVDRKEEVPERLPAARETVEAVAEAPAIQTQTSTVMAKKARPKTKGNQVQNNAIADTAHDELAATAAITSGTRLMRDVNAAQWTLSPEGIPQRSFNSGKTWEKVQVDHHKTFRALSAQGMDVWVGGLAGVLYHSSDVGLHWTRIIPVAENSALTADILSIDFRDAMHGKLITSNRESWITSDAGKTWQKE